MIRLEIENLDIKTSSKSKSLSILSYEHKFYSIDQALLLLFMTLLRKLFLYYC